MTDITAHMERARESSAVLARLYLDTRTPEELSVINSRITGMIRGE